MSVSPYMVLLRADDRSEREAILVGAEALILDDLARLLDDVGDTDLTDLWAGCREALEATAAA